MAADSREKREPPDDAIKCAACGHRITSRDLRIDVAGTSAHVFVNPHGLVFELVCFAAAPGVVELASPETAFSWFPGYSWQIVACAKCRAHVGWRYRVVEGHGSFHGLIVAALQGI